MHRSLTRLALSAGLLAAAFALFNLGFGIGGPQTASAAHDHIITIEVESPDGGTFAFDVDASPPCNVDAFTLSHNDSRNIRCHEATVDVSVDLPPGFALASAPTCGLDTDGEGTTPGMQSTVAIGSGGNITIDITDKEHLLCTYTFEALGGTITIIKDAPDANGEDFDFRISGTGSACDDYFILEDDESAQYTCDAPGTYTIAEIDLPTGWALVGITCSDRGISSSDIDVSLTNGRVQVTLTDDGESLTCTFTNEPVTPPTATTTATPTATATPSKPSGITITAPSTITCGHSASITVLVTDAFGRTVANGTAVSLFASIGTVNPQVIGTINGSVLAIYKAPDNFAGAAAITARANGAAEIKTINVICAVPATATPTSTSVPFVPPSTGSGGLTDADSTNEWAVYAGVLITATALGGYALLRRRTNR